jgi:hypothetical protein
VGYQQTAEEYYKNRVQDIITSTVNALKDDPKRKFSWTELYYFSRWWSEQTGEAKKEVRELAA